MAAMRLASKGKSLADSSYDSEVKSILAFLSMQHPAPAPVINPESLDIQPELYLAPRFVRRIRGKVSMSLEPYLYDGNFAHIGTFSVNWTFLV